MTIDLIFGLGFASLMFAGAIFVLVITYKIWRGD